MNLRPKCLALLLPVLLVGWTGAADRNAPDRPARYLYVWAGTSNGLNIMTVLDA